MANQDKDIVITPNRGSSTADPNIRFTGGNATVANSINVSIYADGTLSFDGTAGQLFSITNSLSGTIFSVNDVSGIPSIEVLDNGTIRLAQYNGNVGIGTGSVQAGTELAVFGGNLQLGTANTGLIFPDGTRQTTAFTSSGAVTSFSAGTTGFTPSTATTGAVTLGGTLAAANGGTGQSSYTIGDLLYASGSTALSKLAGVATGNSLISGGVGVAPSWGKIGLTSHVSGVLPVANGGTNSSSASGTALDNITGFSGTGIMRRTGAGTYTFGTAVSLTTEITGTLGVANGGTGATTLTSNGVLYGNGTSAVQITAQGATNSVLTANGGAPTFSATPTLTSLTTTGDIALNGGDLTTTSTTATLFNATVTTLNIGQAATTISMGATTGTATFRNANSVFNGNIGIGTSIPIELLDVFSNNAQTGYNDFIVFRQGNNAGGSNFSRMLLGQISTNSMFIEASDQSNVKGILALQPYGGNVSIGTSSVAYPTANRTSVAINGTNESLLGFYTNNAARGYLIHNGATMQLTNDSAGALVIQSSQAQPLTFNTNSTERLRITSTGGVGIGTSSPNARLHTSGPDDITGFLMSGATRGVRMVPNAVGTVIEGVDQTGSASYQPLIIGGSTVLFTTSNTERMRITNTGNVGIGTTTTLATTQLAVFGGNVQIGTASRGIVFPDGTFMNTAATAGGVTTFSAGTTGLTPSTATSGAITLAGTLVVGNGGTGATTLTSNGVLYGNGTSAVQVTAQGSTNTVLTANGGAPSFSATPTLTSLTTTGDIALNGGDLTTTSTTATLFNATATTLNIGQAATTISIGATTGTATFRNATSAFDGTIDVAEYVRHTGDTDTWLRFPAADNITLGAGNQEKLRATTVGIGINGVNTPANALDVSGAVVIGSGGAYAGSATAPANGLLVQGSVGIGTISPSSMLTIQGADVSPYPRIVVKNSTAATGSEISLQSGYLFSTNDILEINSGYYSSGGTADKPIIFSTGNSTERMRINSSGDVSIGTTGTDYGRNWRLVARQDYNGTTQIGVINATVGASAVAQIVKIGGTANSFLDWALADSNGAPFDSFSYGSGVNFVRWEFGGTERMRITNSGNVGIGTSTVPVGDRLAVFGGNIDIGSTGFGIRFPDNTFQTTAPTGGGATITNDTSTNSNNYFPAMTNNQTSGSWTSAITSSTKLYFNPSTGTLNATVFNSLSDAAAKTDIMPITGASNLIESLTGVRFSWKDNSGKSAGLLAQDVEKIMPELVSTAEHGKSLNYNGVIGLLVEAIKDLKAELADLKRKLDY
jgi:hypothetical protein